jgi:hypothetical protein
MYVTIGTARNEAQWRKQPFKRIWEKKVIMRRGREDQ